MVMKLSIITIMIAASMVTAAPVSTDDQIQGGGIHMMERSDLGEEIGTIVDKAMGIASKQGSTEEKMITKREDDLGQSIQDIVDAARGIGQDTAPPSEGEKLQFAPVKRGSV
ncbi:hypothetical protein BC941DRAFT_466520 [Chlamydoabsidia padenii]|nr:hypothetical protein BC941DRAFT_466520 [Chlamydoabsidia padenii]